MAHVFAKAKKHQEFVSRRVAWLLLACICIAAIWLWPHRNNPRIVNYATDLIPGLLAILIAFVPDLRRQHLAWRFSIVAVGIIWSILLWRKEDLANTTQAKLVTTAVSDANKHSDAQIERVQVLAQEAIGAATGGDSYPRIFPFVTITDNQPGFPLTISVIGKYNLVDATIQVISHTQDLPKLDPQVVVDRLLHPPMATFPMISANQATVLPLRVDPQGERDEFGITVVARNGRFSESLIMKKHGIQYDSEWTIRDTAGKILETLPKHK